MLFYVFGVAQLGLALALFGYFFGIDVYKSTFRLLLELEFQTSFPFLPHCTRPSPPKRTTLALSCHCPSPEVFSRVGSKPLKWPALGWSSSSSHFSSTASTSVSDEFSLRASASALTSNRSRISVVYLSSGLSGWELAVQPPERRCSLREKWWRKPWWHNGQQCGRSLELCMRRCSFRWIYCVNLVPHTLHW